MVDALHTFDFDAVWDDLVDQFADPLSCLRELVQNAIDAESGEVDVEVEFDAGQGETAGRMILHVRDWGVGMDREVIEGRLTDLFHSGKAEDYTKIGRFGIGFVSVFALEPTVVCVDTGRSGEYWRILFHGDGSFELLALDRPVEGTHIRIVKPMRREEVETLRGRVREVLGYWCKHASIPVRFEGDDVREPFEVDSACTVTHREEGTRIVAGLVRSTEAPYGYYNRGLTLEEGDRGPTPHVAFKIDSRYLEHTLTRDKVVENEDYHKARERLETLVDAELPARLIDQLEASAASETVAGDETLFELLTRYLREYGEPPGEWRGRPIVSLAAGGAMELAEVIRAAEQERLLIDTVGGRAPEPPIPEEILVVRGAGGDRGLGSLLRRLTGKRIPELRSRYAMPEVQPASEGTAAARLFRAAEPLFEVLGMTIEPVGVADFSDCSALDETFLVAAEQFDRPLPIADVPAPTRAALADRDRCVLHSGHALADRLLSVADREPEWAAFNLVKLVGRSDLSVEEDARLVEVAVERRRKRRETS